MHPAEIQALLKMKGVSQSEIGREFGLSRSTVSAVVNGRSRSAQVEQRISEILGIPATELWPHWYGSRALAGVTGLTGEERALVEAFRALTPAQRQERLPAALDALASRATGAGRNITASGKGSAAAGGNIHIGSRKG